ncbi:solute carrier family 12 member 1-like [Uloborus diversus]|uniref:solute carrier family 12 member 1-like n=1 Tax=Uloborus diversus TaxID=327109 RepID=UPI0024094B16|nr:solute carrier family 12 member 1-like [Uloborus diversus]
MEETKSTGNRFKVSAVGYENTAFENGDDGNNILEVKPARRSSSFLGDFLMGRRRSSTMYGTDALDGNLGRKSRKHSIFIDFFKDPANSIMDYGHEAAPRLESYRNSLTVNQYMVRPTLDQLHQAQQDNKPALTSGKGQSTGAVKFGWVKGVYIRCLLNIWGVMLFLRMGWMTGQCGIGLAIVIVLLSTVVTVITTLSMSAICTNGDVRGGGAYYLISRSLGPEFGGVVGILLFLANAVSGAMYIIGAGEGIQDILKELGKGIVEFPSGKK